jgi:sensor domain CHASE-containing protein
MVETIKDLQRMADDVVSVYQSDPNLFEDISAKLDNVLLEIKDLGQQIETHGILQEQRWQLLKALGSMS